MFWSDPGEETPPLFKFVGTESRRQDTFKSRRINRNLPRVRLLSRTQLFSLTWDLPLVPVRILSQIPSRLITALSSYTVLGHPFLRRRFSITIVTDPGRSSFTTIELSRWLGIPEYKF
ncbi:hypothetical protein O6P43_033407 [Quillaja saponaria]|uniref:Uncharacterized protein n=1 Tax=Quillaja saponaria TaxID=32244 RepID=A0AAD7KQG8_QUISA|nr:hypothetical protein O6P43_033407 [Quillaja saponaria]